MVLECLGVFVLVGYCFLIEKAIIYINVIMRWPVLQ